jgi:hypothetical protein
MNGRGGSVADLVDLVGLIDLAGVSGPTGWPGRSGRSGRCGRSGRLVWLRLPPWITAAWPICMGFTPPGRGEPPQPPRPPRPPQPPQPPGTLPPTPWACSYDLLMSLEGHGGKRVGNGELDE